MISQLQLTENKVIAITFFMVLALAFPTYQTLAQKDGTEEDRAQTAQGLTPERNPASLPPASVKPAKMHSHFQHMDLNCAKTQYPPVRVAGAFLQLQGKNCGPSLKDGDVEIINRSNGFTASVFPKGVNQYQTDLIQLKEGDNEIVIRYRRSTGQSVEETLRVTSASI